MLQNISKILLTEEQIQTRVKELAAELSKEYAGKDPVFVGVLKGVVVFYADFMKNFTEYVRDVSEEQLEQYLLKK